MMDGWCELQETVCQLAKAIAVPAATIYLSPFPCRVRRTVNQIGSLIERQIVISADRRGVSDLAGLRVLLVRARLQELGLCCIFGSPSLEYFLGVVQKGPAVSKEALGPPLCLLYMPCEPHGSSNSSTAVTINESTFMRCETS